MTIAYSYGSKIIFEPGQASLVSPLTFEFDEPSFATTSVAMVATDGSRSGDAEASGNLTASLHMWIVKQSTDAENAVFAVTQAEDDAPEGAEVWPQTHDAAVAIAAEAAVLLGVPDVTVTANSTILLDWDFERSYISLELGRTTFGLLVRNNDVPVVMQNGPLSSGRGMSMRMYQAMQGITAQPGSSRVLTAK